MSSAIIMETIRTAEGAIYRRTGQKVKLVVEAKPETCLAYKPKHIMRVVAHALFMDMEDYKVPTRRRENFHLRMIATNMLFRYYPGITYAMIGELFGHADHTTVIHYNKKLSILKQTDMVVARKYKDALDAMEKKFGIKTAINNQ